MPLGNQRVKLTGSVYKKDIIILVIGPTGSGKSTSIKSVTGKNVEVSAKTDLWPCTKCVQAHRCRHPDNTRDVVLIDTPGYDDDEKDIFSEIQNWLMAEKKKVQFSGILHLYRISNEVDRSVQHPCQSFERSCEIGVFTKTVLATTMLDEEGSEEDILKKEEKLNKMFLERSRRNGAKICRVDSSSPWEVINKFTPNNGHVVIEGRKISFEPEMNRDEPAQTPKLGWETIFGRKSR